MITENNYWEYLILHSRRKLTIPYIIGSKKIMLRCLKYDSVYDLFEKITNSNTDKVFSFYFCTDIGEYAVRSDFPGYAMKGIEVKNPINNKTTIVLSLGMSVIGRSKEEIIDNLSKKYSEKVENECFSYNNFKWDEYEDYEIDEIKNIVNKI